MRSSLFERVYEIVRHIPPGKVATYGQIAHLLGMPRAARTVGWALASMPNGSDVPWQRVINAQGTISLSAQGHGAAIQRALLESEGVAFDERGRVDLAIHGWTGLDLAERQQLISPDAQ
jgi:methylated-DNA-protein-cysteine methyltransferase-like protein